MATEISVPIRLKVLQDSISEFQKILDNLQPNTKNWKDLSRIISQMTSESQKLQAQLSTPFSSQKQFSQTEKTIDKLEEAAARVQVVMNGLKFSDIQLTPAQSNQLQALNDEINAIRDSYKKLQEETKQKLLSNSNNTSLLGAIPKKEALTKDFDGIKSAVDQHVKDLERSVDNQKKQFERLRSNIELGEKATALTTSGKGLTREALGDSIFDKYLSETEKGLRIKSWNNGVTKQALLTELEKMFSLSPGELQSLAGKTIDEINKAFQEMGKKGNFNPFSGIISRGKNDKKNEPIFNSTAIQIQEQLKQYQALQAEIDKLKSTNLDPVSSVNTTKIDELTGKMNTLRTSIIANVTSNNNYKSSMQDFSAGLGQARTALQETNAEFLKMQAATRSFDSLKMTITNFLGFYQVLNLTKRAIQEAANHIKELDTVMNKISIVTDMDTSDLWEQIDQYSSMAQRYGTTIKGAYEVSQIYYQQGLDTADVLTLTNETLKLAKISGLDYASTTDYMTTAIRGFKMEMSEAATVVDVYSALAANTAVSQEELAVAMSKTASSMESVGSTFQETSAMIGTMVAVTRESATNIGSAMKSIASRYGELTKDPAALVDSEGEAMSFNKVDTALQSVGISMKTAEGQFREFTDVIVELGEKWSELDSTQQRYIATQFAGNRQQSRFLALVSNIDLLKQNIEVAENSEDVGTVQALKALDSLESKIEQVRVAYQQFYTTIGIESVWKGFLDGARSVVDTLNGMPKLFGKIPIAAINAISIVVSLIKNLALRGLAFVSRELMPSLAAGLKSGEPQMQKAGESLFEKLNQAFLGKYAVASATGQQMAQAYAKGVESGFINPNKTITQDQYNQWLNTAMTGKLGSGSNLFGIAQDRQTLINDISSSGILTTSGLNILQTGSQQEIINFITTLRGAIAEEGATATQATGGIAAWSAAHQAALGNIMGVAQAVQLVALAIPTATSEGKAMSGALQAISGAGIAAVAVIKAIGAAAEGTKVAMPWMAIASGIVAVISGITQALQATSIEAKLDEITKKAQTLSDEAKQLKSNFNILDTSIKKINELEKARYDSAEAAEEYQTAVDKLAETYPELVASYDLNNEAVLNVNAMEEILAKARDESAAATLRAAQAEAEKAKTEKEAAINKLHTENDALEEYTLFGGKADVNLTEKRKLHRYQVNGEGASDLTTENLEELYDFIDIIKNAGEQHQTDKIIETYQELNKYLVSKKINLDSDLTSALTKAVNAAYTVKGYDNVIETANRTSVSAFMNSYYGNSDSISAFKDNSGLLAAATDELYNHVQNGQYDTVSLTQIANDIFAGIDTLYTGISDNRRKEIDTILSNPSHYSKSDIQTLLPELVNTKWINDYFDRQIQYNKEQLINKIDQLKTNRKAYDNGKLDESLTLIPDQIQQFESIIDDNITLDLRNLMISGINQAQNLKKTGQNPQEFIDYFTEFYQQVSTLPADLRNSLIEQFSANGFTKEGLTKTLDWINNNEDIKKQNVNFSSLENMTKSFVPNISLTVASLEDSLTNNLDDIESIFSDLQNGIKGSKLGKTIAKAQELGLDLERSDFKEDGDKFVLRYEKFADLISHIDDIYTMALPEEGEFEKAYKNLTRIVFGDKLVDLHRVQDIQAILGSTYYDYFDANDQLKAGITSEQVYDALEKAYASTDADLEQYQAWLKIIEQHLTKTIDWKHGDYSTLEGKVDLTQTDESGAAIDTAYKRVQYLAAHPDAYTESELKEADVSNAVETYQKGLGDLLTDLSKYGANYLTNRGDKYEGVAAETVSNIQKLANEKGTVAAIRTYGEQAEMSISEINNAIIEAVAPGRAKSLTNMIGKSTTLSDLAKYAETYKIGEGKVEQFLTEDGKLGGELGKLYDLDALTGELKLKSTSTTFDQVLAAYKADLKLEEDITGDLRNQLYQAWIASIISEEDKNDAGKQMASAISSLSSAKLGTRVDLSKSPELAEKLGTIYEVTSEAARDAMLLALDASEFDDAEVRAAIISTQSTIRSKQASRTNINTLLSSNISQDTARNYIAAITDVDASLVDDKTLEGYMKNRGYVWSAIKQEFIATEEALSWYDEQIAAVTGTPEEKAALREKRNQIEQELHKNHANEAILNVLSNAEDAADALTTFQAWFPDIDINDFTTTDNEGKRKVDIEKLKEAVGADYEKLFNNYINQIADEYINNAQTAGSLMTQGTTSKTEMDAFQKAYEKVMGEGSVAQFMYDAVTHTMVLDPTQLRSYLTSIAAKKEFGLTPEQQKDWVDSQIEALTTDNLDFSKVLDGSATEEDTKSLKRNLEQYIKTNLPDEYKLWSEADQKEFIEGYADHIIADIEQGGQVAIDAIKSTGKELSTEEIEAAYRAQVAPLVAISEKLSELQVGSVVAANQIAALNDAGFTVDENGVVIAVGNMVEAYKSIYYQMQATGEATTTELNDAYAQLLTAEDQRNIDITEALKNGNGMSYADFGKLLSKYDKSFEEYMTEHYDAVMRDGFGNIRITDWNAFAESIWGDSLDQIKNTPEYVSAFKAYNDGLIELNKNTEQAIVDEIKQIEGAKAGDQINLTNLWMKLNQAIEEAAQRTDFNIPDLNGNVNNMGNRVIVSREAMQKMFPEDNYTGDYSTVYGQEVAFSAISQLGAVFANLTETGERAAVNIDDYAKKLYALALEKTNGIEEDITAELIKSLDAENENLIVDIQQYYDASNEDEILDLVAKRYEIIHEAEENSYSDNQVASAIGKKTKEEQRKILDDELESFGAYYTDGILTIGDNANLLGIAQTLEKYADIAGLEIGNGLEEVKDTVLNILKSYSEAITKGISGGMTTVEASDLVQKAQNFGIADLQFNETAEGFQLAESSAIKLYQALKSIDALHSAEAFNALSESLQKTNDNFKSTSALIAHINNIRNDTYAADDTISNARKEQYQQELEIAEEILRVRATSEDDSFNFMDQKIPAAQNNPLNYWKGWEKALTAINQSKKTGRMDYSDFYNLMTELGNLSSMIGGKGIQIGKSLEVNSENFQELIAKGAANLTATAKDTELKVNLPKIDVDFSSADNFAKDVDQGIQQVADAQIEMLDGLIALLETIVAMEKLNDITEGGEDDNIIDLGDIFPKIQFDAEGNVIDPEALEYVDDYAKFLEYIQNKARHNKDLEKALSEIKLDGISLDKIFGMTPQELGAKGEDFIKAYTSLLEGLRQASISGNYDVDNIMTSVQEVLAESGLTGFTVDTGKTTLVFEGGTMTEINWEDQDTAEILKKVTARMRGDEDAAKQAILDAEKSYKQGKGTGNLTLEEVLTVENKIKIDPKTGEKSVIVGNETYNQKDPNWQGALEAQSLLNMGVDSKNIQIESDRALTTEYHIGNKSNITVEAKQGITTITGTGAYGETITGNSQDEWLKNYVSSFREQSSRYGETEAAKWTDNQILWRTLEIRVNTETKVVDGKGNKIDISNDAARRQEITDLRNQLQQGIAAKDLGFQESGDGNWTKTLDAGGTLVIDGSKIDVEVEGNNANAQFVSELDSALGIDQALSDTIAAGIGKAFSDLSTNLDSIDSSKISSLASALAEIAAALADIASKDIEKQIEQIKQLMAPYEAPEINVPEEKVNKVAENVGEAEGNAIGDNLTESTVDAVDQLAQNGEIPQKTGELGEHSGQTLVDKFAKELSNLAEQVLPQIVQAAQRLSEQTAIMGEAGQTLGKAIVEGIAEGMKDILQTVQAINPLLLGMAAGIAGIGLTSVLLVPLRIILEAIAEKLGEIKENSNIDIKIQADAENVAGELQKVIDKLKELAELASLNPEDSEAPKAPGGTPKQLETTNQDSSQKMQVTATTVDVGDAVVSGALSKVAAANVDATNVGEVKLPAAQVDKVETSKETTIEAKLQISNEDSLQLKPLEIEYKRVISGDPPKAVGPFDTIYRIDQHGNIPGPAGPFHVHYYIHNHGTPGGGRGGAGHNGGATVDLVNATGNVGLAKARGTQTLMGELGPELVVSNGRYFVAGQNGAEMVNLAEDAIVFNHLQTEQLLKNGMSKGRGRAVTNERNAVAFATGNAEGPAMASASAALNALKQLRAMWESLKSASISDLAGAGGGGGGGGGGDNAKIVDPSIWVDTVERWYNLMQKIAKLEKEITHEEKLRSKLSSDWTANGNHYYASQKRSLEALRDQIDAQEQLNLSREAYYDQRVEALQNQPFGKLIEFDNEGQMRFKEGAMDWLTNLVGFDQNGKANYTDEEKYNILMAAGYGDYMKYDSNGGEIKMDDDNDGEVTDDERQSFYGEATQAFWDKINDYKDATQSLWDSIKEGEDSILQLQADQNELLEEIRENQMAVEDAVLDAIEDMRQREIDALQDERDKLEESTQKYIDGLSDALNREQEMYQNQEDENSLNQQKRRLAILQRSGGSAEDIANLRAEIDSSERERYFNLQQQQIDAIQRASDLEIERMDSQIELMTETLEYQKEYGLLWGNVYEVMEGTAAQITSFIMNGNSEFWALSPLGTADQANQTLFKAEQWSSYRKDLNTVKEKIGDNEVTAKDIRDNMALMVTMTRRQLADTDYTIFDEAMKAEFGEDYDPNSAYKQLFYDDYMGHGDVTRATATARAKYAADKKAAEDAAAAAQAAAEAAAAAEEPHGGEPEENKGCPDCAVNCGGACYNACENHCAQGCKGGCKNGCKDTCKDTCTNSCTVGPMSKTGYTGADRNTIGGTPARHAASGGYVNHGIYELGERGTETVLTASQTKILRDNILSNRPNSLISLLKSYNEGYDGINNSVSGVTPVEDNSTVIEKVELNMEVKQIANDYDARRAGEQALNEMMRIARKTGAANSIRR